MATVLQYAPNIDNALSGSDVPEWLIYGWISVESGGKVSDNDTTAPQLGGEQGLFQLSAEERSDTHYTDSNKILSDPDYSIAAGLALITYIRNNYIDPAGGDPSWGETYWMLIKYAHGAGEPSVRNQIQGYLADPNFSPSATGNTPNWDDFSAYALTNPIKTSDYTDEWLSNAERVRSTGMLLAPVGAVSSAVASAIPGGSGTTALVILGSGLALAAGYYLFLQGKS